MSEHNTVYSGSEKAWTVHKRTLNITVLPTYERQDIPTYKLLWTTAATAATSRGPSSAVFSCLVTVVVVIGIAIDDGLPEYVCQDCLGIIKEFENYKRNAQRAKKELMLLKEKKNVLIKAEPDETEEYLEDSEPHVASDDQIHEPQIEIHETLSYGNEQQEKVELDTSKDNDQLHSTGIRRRRKQTPEEKKFKCAECGKCFAFEERLKSHTVVHSGEKLFGCEQCGRKFYRKTSLSEHFMTHSKNKPYECKTCTKQFIRRYDLEAHLMLHRGVKPFRCAECGKGFLKNNQLTRHAKIHSGLKPWECTKCGKGFVRKCDLKRHELIHGS
ncbi:hypothetical protein J437_LFUL017299 [Ladona fulva]|uniref:C2H2-type domain-containing protein n=1 Tax=Ladona fulva TaxID=123851 RepID=A0A8K0KTU3_LADFU|nr:hypothetical protein J437_LFUL017299 [Ladona fulva]